jgi:DNA repair protein RadA
LSPKELRKVTLEELKAEPATEDKSPQQSNEEVTDKNLKSLCEIRGVGPKTAEKLRDFGYCTIFDLATARADELKEQMKVTYQQAQDWVHLAQEKVMAKMKLKKSTEQDKEKKDHQIFIATGSKALNNLLGGGIATGAVTGLAGRFASGKSQICFEAIVEVLGKHNKKAVFVETEPNTFSLDRLKEIAKSKGYNNINWDNLYVCEASQIPTMKAQYLQYKLIQAELEKGEPIILIVIDSFNAKIRGGWSRSEMLPLRTRELGEHFNLIEVLAAKYNIAWLLTCQSIAPVRPDQGLGAMMKYGDQFYPVGGDYMLHSVQTWLGLHQIKTDEWMAVLFDSSYLPRGKANFSITQGGIRDVVE